jgi:hypothetical protein
MIEEEEVVIVPSKENPSGGHVLYAIALVIAVIALLIAAILWCPKGHDATVHINGLPSVIHSHTQYTGTITGGVGSYIVVYSDRLDVQTWGHRIRISEDYPGVAYITAYSSGVRVYWNGTAVK